MTKQQEIPKVGQHVTMTKECRKTFPYVHVYSGEVMDVRGYEIKVLLVGHDYATWWHRSHWRVVET